MGRGDLEMIETTGPRPPFDPRRRRWAFCPLCGQEQVDLLASAVRHTEDALCPDRCAAAWQALAAVRGWESGNKALATRKRAESEAHEPHAPTLSELLRQRWQAGDWTVAPDDVLGRLS